MFNIGLIDSLKLRIERDKIIIVDPSFILPYIKFYPDNLSFETALNDSEPLTKIINGITYRYYFKCYPNKKGFLVEYLVLQVSAKMLKEQYFEGITLKNYKRILDDINKQYIVKISESVFLDALVSDIDICINQLVDIESYQNALKLLYNHPKNSVKPLLNIFNNQNKKGFFTNLGLDFNKREKAKNTTPYCKIYHKGLELQFKSTVFYTEYLQGLQQFNRKAFIDNLVRYEFTIKAYDHKEYLKKQGLLNSDLKTFNDLLSIPTIELTLIAKSGIKHYTENKIKVKPIKDISPIDNLLLSYMTDLISFGYDRDNLKHPVNSIVCPVTKSRIKTKINQLLKHIENENVSMSILLQQNNQTQKFLKNIGF